MIVIVKYLIIVVNAFNSKINILETLLIVPAKLDISKMIKESVKNAVLNVKNVQEAKINVLFVQAKFKI